MQNPKIVLLLIRIGLASVYLYAGIASIVSPNDWIAFLPPFLKAFVSLELLLLLVSILQILLGIWLLTGIKSFYAGLVSAILISGIIIINLNALDITFRDFTILFSSLALSTATFRRINRQN